MNKSKIFRALACALLASAFAVAGSLATPVAAYADDTIEVATCDGVGYATLQEAFDAAKEGSTVTLLSDITLADSGDNGASCRDVKNLTFDLGMHEVSYFADAVEEKEALRFTGCEGLKVKNGYIEATDADAVYLDECLNFEFSGVDFEAKGDYGSAIVSSDSTGKILGGSYEGAMDDHALYLIGGSVEILGGSFAGGKGDGDDDDEAASVFLSVYTRVTLTVHEGSFFGAIEGGLGGLSITGGSFDSFANASEVDKGHVMLKRAGESGMCEVVTPDDEGIPADAFWRIVAKSEDDEVLGVFFFEDGGDAKEYFDECEKESEGTGVAFTLEQLRYKVSFVSRNEDAGSRVVRAGQPVGKLPAGEEVSGWDFSGWYNGDAKVDETFVPAGDVTLVAKWVKSGSDEESDEPDDKGDDSDKGDKDDKDDKGDKGGSDEKGGKSDKAMPQTGDTTNAALPVCIAIAGVLVCAFGLVFKAHRRK